MRNPVPFAGRATDPTVPRCLPAPGGITRKVPGLCLVSPESGSGCTWSDPAGGDKAVFGHCVNRPHLLVSGLSRPR